MANFLFYLMKTLKTSPTISPPLLFHKRKEVHNSRKASISEWTRVEMELVQANEEFRLFIFLILPRTHEKLGPGECGQGEKW